MTSQTAVAKKLNPLFWCRKRMRIMTRDASHAAGALLKTFAGFHLPHLIHGIGHPGLSRSCVALFEYHPDGTQRIAGTKIFRLHAETQNSFNTQLMTIVADTITNVRGQINRVDDGIRIARVCPSLDGTERAGHQARGNVRSQCQTP